MIWFTADTHYWHKNVVGLCNRPFKHLHEMHEHMIAEWNKRVQPTEKVYVLGDFSFGGTSITKKILDRLNGYKILITGNHDHAAHKSIKAGFQEVHENIWITLGTHKVFLSHFPFHPMNSYGKYPDGRIEMGYPYSNVDKRYMHKRIVDDGTQWLIHGHVHNSWKQNGRQINVGVDVWEFAPVGHEKILNMIELGPRFDGKTDNDYGD